MERLECDRSVYQIPCAPYVFYFNIYGSLWQDQGYKARLMHFDKYPPLSDFAPQRLGIHLQKFSHGYAMRNPA